MKIFGLFPGPGEPGQGTQGTRWRTNGFWTGCHRQHADDHASALPSGIRHRLKPGLAYLGVTMATLLLASALSGCVGKAPAPPAADRPPPDPYVTITASGLAAMPTDPALSESQRRLLGQRAARAEALRALAEQAAGVEVNGSTRMSNLAVTSDQLRTRTAARLRGAEIIEVTETSPGVFEAVARLRYDPRQVIDPRQREYLAARSQNVGASKSGGLPMRNDGDDRDALLGTDTSTEAPADPNGGTSSAADLAAALGAGTGTADITQGSTPTGGATTPDTSTPSGSLSDALGDASTNAGISTGTTSGTTGTDTGTDTGTGTGTDTGGDLGDALGDASGSV